MRDYHLIEERTLRSLLGYIGPRKLPVGDFLRCVLTNDLKNAVAHADTNSLRGLAAIVTWLHNRAPAECWGSPAAFCTWGGMPDADFERWRERALADTCLR